MNYTTINPETIKKSMFEETEMIKQFIAIYLQQSPLDFEKLEQSLAQENIKSIGDDAHHIKPTMEYIGATKLKVAFQNLENLCRETTDIELVRTEVAEIRPLFQTMLDELKHYTANIG